jgi:hypothetical protein
MQQHIILPGPSKPYVTRFINSDLFEGDEQICRRAELAATFISGNGLEIGALHKPLVVDGSQATVKYIDYKTKAENRKRYPELADEAIVDTDLIDDGFILNEVAENAVDFLIANHALEHSPDPLGTLEIWLNRLKVNGVLYITVPIAAQCYDSGRAITTIEHLVKDHRDFVSLNKNEIISSTSEHLKDFITISGANIRKMNNLEPAPPDQQEKLHSDLVNALRKTLSQADSYEAIMDAHINQINRVYDIHYHTFTPTSYEDFIAIFCERFNAVPEMITKNGNGECIAIIRKLVS